MVLAWQLDTAKTKRQGAWVGWLFACVMQVATWWWLYISLHKYGGLAAPLTVMAIVGLAAFLALYHAATCALYVALAPVNVMGRAILFAAMWLLAELCRVALFTGFPWGEGGYAQLDGPLDGLAKIVGVHGLTFASAYLAFLLVRSAATLVLLTTPATPETPATLAPPGQQRLFTRYLLALAVLVVAAAAGAYFQVAQPTRVESKALAAPFSVALLQGNIAQDQKFQPTGGLPDALDWYGQQLLAATASLVITPETALPVLPGQLPEGYLDALLNRFMHPAPGAPPTAALIGLPLGSSEQGYTNSAIALKPGSSQRIYQYDKHHLVPFGEFVHPLFKWFLAIVNMPLSDFNRGDAQQPSFNWQGQRIAPNICYEDLFGEELAARFIDPTAAPTIMVNISNIAWFGNSVAIDQHLNISRMRALEFERPMVRATNTGATAIIDHTGQVTHLLARHTRGVLQGTVEGRGLSAATGWHITPYAWWAARFGLWPWWGLVFAALFVAAYPRFYGARSSPFK